MLLEVDSRDQSDPTAVTVTLKLDAEDCFLLARTFQELGEALGRAQRTYKARRAFEAGELDRQDAKEAQWAAIASKLRELKELPPRKAVSVIAREMELPWDIVDLTCIEIRRAERRAAALRRDEEVMQLSKNGASAASIGARLNLATGTVKNILTRLRKAESHRQALEAMAAAG